LFADTLLDCLTQGVFSAGEGGFQLAQDESEDLLVPPAVNQAMQRTGDDVSAGWSADDARHDSGEDAAGTAILYGLQQVGQHGGESDGRGAGGDRVSQEAVDDFRQVQPGQDVGDLLAGKDVVGDEAAEGLAEAGSLVRDDGCMGNWDAQRMAKKRGYGEPIRDAADESGFGGRLQQAVPPGLRNEIGRKRKCGHQEQKAGGEHAVVTQCAPGEEVRIGIGHRRPV
jgi:hypothetical protein